MTTTYPPAETRFWQRVLKSDGCWEWQGGVAVHGYGRIHSNGSQIRVHRYSYELNVGPIPDGLYVLHRCDNRRCVRPDHLFLGTHLDNLADMYAKGRQRYRPLRGEDHNQAKLNEGAVLDIRRRYEGETNQSLAEEFGVSIDMIWRIGVRKNWRHLP